MNEPLSLGFAPLPRHAEREGGHREGKPRLEGRPGPLGHFLHITAPVPHRQHGCPPPPGIPKPPSAELAMSRSARLRRERRIPQAAPRGRKGFAQRRASGGRRMGPGTVPGPDQAQVVQAQTEVTPAKPARVGCPFAAHLLCPAPCPPGVEQLQASASDAAQDRGGSPKLLPPRPGRAGNQRRHSRCTHRWPDCLPLGAQSAPQRDPCARPQSGQRRFRAFRHCSISPLEHLTEKVLGRPVVASSHGKGVATRSLEPSHNAFLGPLKLAPLVSSK
jgi:hypothetical protein